MEPPAGEPPPTGGHRPEGGPLPDRAGTSTPPPGALDRLGRLAREASGVTGWFTDAGHRLWLVGGSVRDALRGRPSPDVDLATDALPDQTVAVLTDRGRNPWTHGRAYGTVGFRHRGRTWEITTLRADRYQPASRRPRVVFGTSIEGDLHRRDFTVNALAAALPDAATDPAGALIDPFGGLSDLLDRRILRTPAPAGESFSEDPLRMLRAARFVAQLGLDLDPEAAAAITGNLDRLSIVSTERVRDELERLLGAPGWPEGCAVLADTGLDTAVLGRSLDEAVEMARRHPDLPPDARRVLVYGDRIDRLRLPGAVQRRLGAMERHVRRLLETPPGRPDAEARRLADALGAPTAAATLELARALADGGRREWLEAVSAALGAMARSGDLDRLGPPLSGTDVMELLGIGPGPEVGEALRWLHRRTIEEGPLTPGEAAAELERWWRSRTTPPG